MTIENAVNSVGNLFDTYKLNDTITLKNRILMAPLTRCMADADLVPTDDMVAYYARRAEAGLIISEATIIRPDAQGYPNTPGIFTQGQIAGWRKVTDAVHANGGKIFVQLWHTGRVAHPHFFGGGDVLAPSAQKIEGSVPRMRELTYVTPKAATVEDIQGLVRDYAKAAENAIEAGFDGVEIHGANGYLIDEFLHHDSNRRTDEYGGTPANMSRFALEVVDAIATRIGKDRTGLRISPVDDSMEFDYLGGSASSYVRAHYGKTLVGVGSYSAQTASKAIAENKFDLIAIGRPFIANPDYVAKVRKGEELVAYSDEMLATLI